MSIDYISLVKQHRHFLEKVLFHDKLRFPLLLLSSEARKVKKNYKLVAQMNNDIEQEFLQLSELSNLVCRNFCYRFLSKILHDCSDFVHKFKYGNNYRFLKAEMKKAGKQYLSIVCIIKNEACYISEWIAYYKIMGVDHIYLFNNGSTDNIAEVIAEHVKSGYVSFLEFKGSNPQLPLYRLAIRCLKGISRWVAFIDADEFVLPTEGTFKEYMYTQEQHPGIGINWVLYGTGGHVERPKGLVTENYLLTFEDRNNLMNLRIKSVVNPKEVFDMPSSHFCVMKNGKFAVDEDGEEVSAKWMYVSGSGPAFTGENRINKIRINHYWTKSEQELREKVNRGYPSGNLNPDFENIMKRIDYPQMKDEAIIKYIAKIKEEMK